MQPLDRSRRPHSPSQRQCNASNIDGGQGPRQAYNQARNPIPAVRFESTGTSQSELDGSHTIRNYSLPPLPQASYSRHANGWTPELEALLVAWAEKASGYAWLHNRSIALFKHRNLWLAVPAALLAYISASTTLLTANDEAGSWRIIVAGLGSLVSGMLINFQELFTFKELSEQHRLSQLGFLAYFRDISCELSVPKMQRKEASEYVTLKRLEMDKLLEHAPDIPPQIVKAFDERFSDVNMHKPDVVSRLQTVIPHFSPLPPGTKQHTVPRRRPLKLDFRPDREMAMPWEAQTDVNDLVEIANSDRGSEGERDDDEDGVPVAEESSAPPEEEDDEPAFRNLGLSPGRRMDSVV
jgi:hypothetical protein